MIKLKDILQEGKVLSVFDFDDTIAKSDAWIYVTKDGKTVKKLDPAQFAIYKPAPEEEFDFKDFDRPLQNPKLIKKNADLLRAQLDKARRSSKGARRVTILTARALGAPVTSFLRSVGIDAYVVPVGSSDPKVKADWIEAQIKKGYDTVYFMDDSPKNIAAVDKMLRRHPDVKSKTSLIKEDYNLDDHPKKKWIKQKLSSIDKRIMDKLFKMYSAVYSAEGLQLSAFSASELQSSYEVVMLIDVDKDPMPDAFIFTRGKVLKLLATDGQSAAKSAVVKKAVDMVKSGYRLEGSKKMDQIMSSKGAPVVLDKKKIEKMVGPKFIKHLEDGYYERKLKKGGTVIKRMYGK